MAKLFKTISLEERYKNSTYNQLPNKTKAGNQGTIALQPIKPSKELESALLKTLPNAIEKNSIILKGLLKKNQFTPPFVNTNFRTAISLADRLLQTKTGTTQHLAQYFLSDTYSNYIKITPFGIFNHISTIAIQQVKFNIAQGGENPVIFNTTTNQGLIYVNGAASSFINIVVPTYNSLLLQGAFLSNGVYTTKIATTTIPLQLNNQGPGTDPKLAISSLILTSLQGPGTNPVLTITAPFLAPLQGPGTNPVLAITNAAILLTHGIITTNNIVKSVINIVQSRLTGTIPQKGTVILGTPSTTVVQDGNVVLNIPKSVVQLEDYSTQWFNSATGQMVSQTDLGTPKGGVELVQTRKVLALPKENQSPQLNQITFEPRYTFPVLNSLRHAADRALARFSPRVKHGSADLTEAETTKGYFNKAAGFNLFAGNDFNGTQTDVEDRSQQIFANMRVMRENDPIPPVDSQGLDKYLSVLSGTNDTTLPDHQKVKYDNEVLGEKLTPIPSQPTLFIGGTRGFSKTNSEIAIPLTPNDVSILNAISLNHYHNEEKNDIIGSSKSKISTSDYGTLGYDQIKNKSTRSNSTAPGQDFRLLVDSSKRIIKYINSVAIDTYITQKGTVETRSPINNDPIPSDFITLKFVRLTSGSLEQTSVSFRSYITSFSDSLTIGINQVDHVNNPTAALGAGKYAKAGSISFKVPFLSKTNKKRIKDKLITFTQIALPINTYSGNKDNSQQTGTETPIINFTFGNYFVNLPIFITSIKYDIQMNEYPWDIEDQEPQIIDISVDYVVTADVINVLPFSKSTLSLEK